MAHEHSVYDNDTHFKIDPTTRQIENTTGKVVLIQHDHDSERFTFEIPKVVEEHDMSKCNVVQIHYLNIETATGTDNEGIYEVADLQVSPDDADVVICSWLISRNATQYVGSLNFVVRFKCVENDGTVSYEWATAIHKGIAVSDSIYNSEVIVAEYADVLEKWRASLFFNTDGVTEDIAMGGHKLTGMGAPTDDADGATKKYVDDTVKNIDLSGVDASDKVSKAGDIMAGQLDMNTNKIIGLGRPVDGTDAANKAYVDEKVGSIDITEQLDEFSAQFDELSAELGVEIDKLKPVLLWQNASPGSDFASQTLTIPGASAYSAFIVFTSEGAMIYKNNDREHHMLAYDKDDNYWWTFARKMSFNGNTFDSRTCYYIQLGSSSRTLGTDNGIHIPLYIYGLKGMD